MQMNRSMPPRVLVNALEATPTSVRTVRAKSPPRTCKEPRANIAQHHAPRLLKTSEHLEVVYRFDLRLLPNDTPDISPDVSQHWIRTRRKSLFAKKRSLESTVGHNGLRSLVFGIRFRTLFIQTRSSNNNSRKDQPAKCHLKFIQPCSMVNAQSSTIPSWTRF